MKDLPVPPDVIEPVGQNPFADAVVFVRSVFDPTMQVSLTRGMLTTIYRLGFLIGAIPSVVGTVLAFQRSSMLWGFTWALVIGPALYLVVVAGLRLVLGFAVVALDLMEQLIHLPAAVDRLTSEVDNLRGGVDSLRSDVSALPPVVGTLNGHVSSLQESVDSVQFWRVQGIRRRLFGDDQGS